MIKHQSIYNNQSKRVYINCRIENFEIYNESKFLRSKHVNYIIEINTFYKNWTIKKRYSEFEELNKILTTKISNLPEFPQKRLFSASDDTISERKKKFENYLNHLFRNINICIYPEILEFIKLEKDLLNLFMINNSVLENTSNSAIKRNNILIRSKSSADDNKIFKSKSYEGEKANNYFTSFLDYKLNGSGKRERNSKSANMLVIEEFLRNLQFKFENKIDIIKTFENFLKSKKNWPTFKLDELSKLFYGDLDASNNNNCGNNCSHRGKKSKDKDKSFSKDLKNANNNNNNNKEKDLFYSNANNNTCNNNNYNANKKYSNSDLIKVNNNNLNNTIISNFNSNINYSNNNNNNNNTKERNNFFKEREKDKEYKEKDISLKGLIYHIGSLQENLLGAEACLEFLGKLINFEFNPECEAYIYMLKITKVDQLINMRLIDHINSGKNNLILTSFNILKAILADDRSSAIRLRKIINDDNVIERFLIWNKINNVN